jgi:hypothetical protein
MSRPLLPHSFGKDPTRIAGLSILLLGLLFGLLSGESKALQAAEPGAIDDIWAVCPTHIRAAETQLELPPHLLTAISKVESGRWHAESKANLAWPWTVMAEGKGRYLPSKAAAIAEVRSLRARGIKNIDVGCMQINLYYHADAFDSLEQAFDPRHNTAYAATLLEELRRKAGSWTRAIGDYHSKTIAFAHKYRRKVFQAWRAERHEENRQQRAIQIAKRQAQKSRQQATLTRPSTDQPASPSAGVWR